MCVVIAINIKVGGGGGGGERGLRQFQEKVILKLAILRPVILDHKYCILYTGHGYTIGIFIEKKNTALSISPYMVMHNSDILFVEVVGYWPTTGSQS